MRRASTIENPFAEVIAQASGDGVPPQTTTTTTTPCKKKGPALRAANTCPRAKTESSDEKKGRRSAPNPETSKRLQQQQQQRTKKTPQQVDEKASLREKCKVLARENEALRARLVARTAAAAAAATTTTTPTPKRAAPVPEPDEDDRPVVVVARSHHHKKRYSAGAANLSSDRRSIASVRTWTGGIKGTAPFVAFAVYGAAARDGECAARLPGASRRRRGYRVRPAELCSWSASFEAPWAALPNFAAPDGVSLEIVEPGRALEKIENEAARPHVTALKHGDSVVYLATYVVPSVERFARAAAVERAVRLAEMLQDEEAEEDDDDRARPETPLAAAEHLLPPRTEPARAGELVGSRAYAALTLREDNCSDVLRFLRYIASRDRRADAAYLRNKRDLEDDASPERPSRRWHDDWDADNSNDDDDDDDVVDDVATPLKGPPQAHLSFQNAGRLASLVRRAHADPRVWEWISKNDDDADGKRPPTSMREWAVAALLSQLPPEVVCRAVDQLLREHSLLVVADHVARASAVALGLVSLLEPLEWQGALIMTLPCGEIDLLGSPVPFVAACSTATAAQADADVRSSRDDDDAALADLRVLFVDRQHDAQFVGAPALRPPCGLLARLDDLRVDRGKDIIKLLAGLSDAERAAVATARAAFKDHINQLLDDLALAGPDACWKRYGEEDASTGDFEFIPDWFLAPIQARVQLQHDLAHTQMLVSHVHALRQATKNRQIQVAAASVAAAAVAADAAAPVSR
ncbi:hypothetical protein CTAYLR_003417 [Chrysophaeum taylorii]|uniref:cDENN domain-containing protein n=1 Tax=Chrysophaeum taylorii TaxID=2483200 RepID=A0AAD7U8E0_9STRA|nr:hypothetical protein CTAYLR_003417 [Chrysophaeum taylorii]